MTETHTFKEVDETSTPLPTPPIRQRRHRRRRFTQEQKEKLVQETYRPGANVSAVARAHNIQPNQLFMWRRKLPAHAVTQPSRTELSSKAVILRRMLADKLAEVDIIKTALSLAERAMKR